MSDWNGRPLLEFLKSRTNGQLFNLYSSPAVSFAVFRLLPELSQQLILKLLWLGCDVDGDDDYDDHDDYDGDCGYNNDRHFDYDNSSNHENSVDDDDENCDWQAWTASDFESKVAEHIDKLTKLRIIIRKDEIYLNPVYRHAYLSAVHMGLYRTSELRKVTNYDEKTRKLANRDLGKKADERWECLLHYLALPSQKSEQGVSGTTKLLFRYAGLTSSENDDGYMEITSAGFQFLLLSRTEQIWTYLLHYFQMQEAAGIDVIPELDFLSKLTLCSGFTNCVTKVISGSNDKCCPADIRAFLIDESWSDTIKGFLMHLRELGLIFIRKRKDGFFFITPLIFHLTSVCGISETAMEKPKQNGFIVVETNYRVYAHTDSNLELAILSTFTEMIYRFSDMSVGVLSREAVRRAFQVGITASQIIAYLRANAHPVTTVTLGSKSKGAVQSVPITVADQIQLWEEERNRLISYNAVLYSSFNSTKEYLSLKEYVNSHGIMLWCDDMQRLLVVTEGGHDSVKAWWKMKVGNGS